MHGDYYFLLPNQTVRVTHDTHLEQKSSCRGTYILSNNSTSIVLQNGGQSNPDSTKRMSSRAYRLDCTRMSLSHSNIVWRLGNQSNCNFKVVVVCGDGSTLSKRPMQYSFPCMKYPSRRMHRSCILLGICLNVANYKEDVGNVLHGATDTICMLTTISYETKSLTGTSPAPYPSASLPGLVMVSPRISRVVDLTASWPGLDEIS